MKRSFTSRRCVAVVDGIEQDPQLFTRASPTASLRQTKTFARRSSFRHVERQLHACIRRRTSVADPSLLDLQYAVQSPRLLGQRHGRWDLHGNSDLQMGPQRSSAADERRDATLGRRSTALYVNASGTVDNVKAGKLADIDPSKSKMIVLDRDLGGVVVSTHNNEGFSGWNPPDPYGQRCVAGPPPSSPAYASAYVNTPFAKISELAVDGITDGNNVIQGRRAYDAKTGQWTSPDQLAGTATYPLSQKPYVWNADNELAFSDPGGNQVFPPTGEPPMLPSPFPPRSLPEAIVDRAFGDVLGGFTGLALGAIGFGVGCAITACTGGEFFGAGIGFATGFGVGYYGAEWIVHEAFNGMYPSSSGTGSDFGNPDSFGQGGSWTSFGIPQAGSAISIAPGDYHTTYYGDGSTLYYNPPYDPTAVTVHGPTGDVTLQPGESAGFSASGLSSSFLTGVANNNALMSNDPMAYVHQSSFL